MRVGMHATRSPLTRDANSITWRCHLALGDFIFAHGQQMCVLQGAPRVGDRATVITRIALAITKIVASCVPSSFFMFQPTARSAAKHSYI